MKMTITRGELPARFIPRIMPIGAMIAKRVKKPKTALKEYPDLLKAPPRETTEEALWIRIPKAN